MATITDAPSVPARSIAIDRIRVPENVRALDQDHVDALAGSIALQGQLVPVIVRPDGEDFMLVAGFHRYAAHRQLGLAEITCELRDSDTEDSDRAVENITRKQLNPQEPGGIALDASFGRSDDAIASEFGRFRGFAAGVVSGGEYCCYRGGFQRVIRIRCNIVAVIGTAGG
jgi:ParB family chromosome partitioning protein